ncbi:response regulator [Pseudanabaena sp. FACHB-1998]|nr:response regulator [Pseudanabaena sp. FACHB-1998]MBD2176990.1 response regulator [Pseudanabaena sp. FACHB-1998]
MSQSQQSCVLVVEGERFAGTFTEQDLFRLIATNQKLDTLKLINVITRSPITIRRSQVSVAEILRLFTEHSLKYLPVLDEHEYPIALITAEHLVQIISRTSGSSSIESEVTTEIQQNHQEALTKPRFTTDFPNTPVDDQHFIQRIVDISPDIIYIYDLQEHRNIYVNNSITSILGYSVSQIQAMGSALFLTIIHSDDLETIIQTQKRFDNAKDGDILELEYRIINANGQYRWFYDRSAVFLRDAEGRAKQIVGKAQDIHKRKLAEEQIRAIESQQRSILEHLQTIVSHSSDGIIILDQYGRIIFANPSAEKIFNLHIGELKGLELGIPITIDKSFEMDFITEAGKLKVAEVLVTQIEWDNELSYLTSIRDISDRKQVEEQLILANCELVRATRLKDEFLASMSHELRTPLNTILGLSESLLEGILGELNERQRKSLETIERSGYHLLELINDILDLAKIESGKLELHLQNTSAPAICDDSLTFVRQLANKKNIQLITKLPLNTIYIYADELRLRQALINLLTNAVKFTPNDGQVTLEIQIINLGNIETSPTYIEFSVTDTGIGIDQKDISKLFQTFVQIDSALNRKYAGTGLGLALVKRIAELHGGHVLLESQIDQGSKFIIRIPYQPHQADSLPYPIIEVNTSLSSFISTKKTLYPKSSLILIADDNEANVASIWDYLESHGYRLLVAKDGLAAVNIVKQEKPDLVLMDIQMPEMDGLEAIKIIRKNPELQSLPIIALTALAMSGDREKCLEAGANEYLAKPVKLKQLVATIQHLLSLP